MAAKDGARDGARELLSLDLKDLRRLAGEHDIDHRKKSKSELVAILSDIKFTPDPPASDFP